MSSTAATATDSKTPQTSSTASATAPVVASNNTNGSSNNAATSAATTAALEKQKKAIAEALKNLPPPISKENYIEITSNYFSQNYHKMTSVVKDMKPSFDAINSLRTLDCKLCYIMLLTPQFHNDALRQLDNIVNLYRQLNRFVAKTSEFEVEYAEDHTASVVAYLVAIRVAFIVNQMASIYYQRGLHPHAAQLFLKSAAEAKNAEELKKKINDELPEEKRTEDEKFDLASQFSTHIEMHECDGLYMAGLTYRVMGSSDELYSEDQKKKIFETASKLQKDSIKSAEQLENEEARERGIAQANFELGVNALLLEQDDAVEYFDTCLEHTKEEPLIENCNFHKILFYRSKDNMEKSLEIYDKLKYNKSAILLSSIYMNAKDYDTAISVIEKELKEKEEKEEKDLEDISILFQLYQQLAQVRIVKKQVADALEAANAAEKYLQNELKDKVDPTFIEKQQDIFKAIYVEQQQYGRVLSFCIHSLASAEQQKAITQEQIEEILPQFAVQSKRSLLFLTETVEPESASFYIFLVTPTGKLHFARSQTETSIEGYAQKALQSLHEEDKSKKAKKDADEVLQEMYKHFITPIKQYIPDDAPLSIVTHLFQIHALSIPFSALKNPETGKHLAEEYCVELTPLQFVEQIEKIQETKEKPLPSLSKHDKPRLAVVASEKTSAEIQRFQKIVQKKKINCEVNLLGKPKKKAVIKELKTAPEMMYFMTGDNLGPDAKEAPTQFGLQLNRSEILIPKDDLKKNYAPDTNMPDTCFFGHVSGTFAFCQYAHHFLQAGVNHVVGFKMVVREKVDDKILLNEEVYPRFFEAYCSNGQDAAKAYHTVMKYLIENHSRLTWSSFALCSRVTPLPKQLQ